MSGIAWKNLVQARGLAYICRGRQSRRIQVPYPFARGSVYSKQPKVQHSIITKALEFDGKPSEAAFKTREASAENNGSHSEMETSTPENIVGCSVRVDKHNESAKLNIRVKDSKTGEISGPICFSNWDSKPWDCAATGDDPGSILTGRLPIGAVTSPGVVLLTYNGPQSEDEVEKAKQLSRVYVSDVTLDDPIFGKVVFSVHSFINAVHTEVYGPRIFFTEEAQLPKHTPKALVADRKLDLDIIKGLDSEGCKIASRPREPADRIEDYDTYNDLGSQKCKRPVLGDPVNMDGFRYPRRLKTNRALNADLKTESAPKSSRWVPADDDFDETKENSFGATSKMVAIPLLVAQLSAGARNLGIVGMFMGVWAAIAAAFFTLFRFGSRPSLGMASGTIGGIWSSFDELIGVYNNDKRTPKIVRNVKLGHDEGKGNILSEEEKDAQTRSAIDALPSSEKRMVLKRAGIAVSDFDAPEQVVPTNKWVEIRSQVNSNLSWPEPFVYKGQHTPPNVTDNVQTEGNARHNAWSTDEEFGRQYKAGMNPFVLAALKKLPSDECALKDNIGLIDRQLEGSTLETLMANVNDGDTPRIFIVDYDKHVADCAAKVNADASEDYRCQYAGRCVLYQREDERLVPVAIELHAPNTSASERVTYTPFDPPQVWQLAKAAFNSIDSGVHQLVSHWLRTHACVEPYIISTDRNLSQMHPVYKLLQPHLQFTYRINADARSILISADGVIELLFTPGSESMQLSARVYEDWQFKDQAFPADVVNRGLAKKTEEGGLKIIANDHPWCEDGLLIWNALHKYVSDYVAIYYKSNADVTSDPELSAWWSEIREKGHADASPSGWPPMETVADLSHILCTIAWTTSAHHASVNFGQADYSSFPLNRSPLLRKPIPEKGTKQYQALTNPRKFEKEFLRYIVNQLPATIHIAVIELLSTHNDNEHYLSDSDQKYISGEAALSVHAQLLEDLAAAEAEIVARNNSGTSKARTVSHGGLPYQLLIPSGVDGKGNPLPHETKSGQRTANRPGRGIPFSISI